MLYAFEKNFVQLIEPHIKEEYDFNEYYLINKNWMNNYKQVNNFDKIGKKLEEEGLNLSYKGYLKNMNKILKNSEILSLINHINPQKIKNEFEKEGNFSPLTDQTKINSIKEVKDLVCPMEFIAIPEKLFNFFYKNIKQEKYSKNNYKFNILIGDYSLFIQDKTICNIFYAYRYKKTNKNLDIQLLIKYFEENQFYNDIKNFIKEKGFLNYII